MCPESERQPDQADELLLCLADGDRRRVLGVLDENESDSLTIRDLSTYLVPEYKEKPTDEEINDQIHKTLVELENVHLPKLKEAGLIETDGNVVTLTDPPAFDLELILALISDEVDFGE